MVNSASAVLGHDGARIGPNTILLENNNIAKRLDDHTNPRTLYACYARDIVVPDINFSIQHHQPWGVRRVILLTQELHMSSDAATCSRSARKGVEQGWLAPPSWIQSCTITIKTRSRGPPGSFALVYQEVDYCFTSSHRSGLMLRSCILAVQSIEQVICGALIFISTP